MKNSLLFEINLAGRFLAENKGQTFLITLGIAIGVAVMVFLTALLDGLGVNLIQETVGRAPHMVISNSDSASAEANKIYSGTKVLLMDATHTNLHPIVDWSSLTDSLEADQRIDTVLPVVEGSGIIKRGQINRSILLRGMDLEQADRIYNISESIIAGRAAPDAILLGKELAADLNITAGEPLQLELPGREPFAIMIDGVFDLGVSSINNLWLVMDQRKASALLGMGDRVSTMEIQVKDVMGADGLADEWAARLPAYKVQSWQDANARLLNTISSQSSSSYTIQFFILLAVILGVASVLAISAVQKSKQIGILKAIGIRSKSVARVFLFQGLALGIVGTGGGFALGLAMSQAFIVLADQAYSLLLKPSTTAIIIILTILSAMLAAYVPARRVSRIDPIEVIRNG